MKTVTVEFLVEDGKDVINVAEIRDGIAGWLEQFFFVVSNKYVGKSWAEGKAHGNTTNLFARSIAETEIK